MNGWMEEKMDGWKRGRIDEREDKDGRKEGRIGGWKGGWKGRGERR